MKKNKEEIEVILSNRDYLDHAVKKTRAEADIIRCTEMVLIQLQDEYYGDETDYTIQRENYGGVNENFHEVIIKHEHLLNIIERVIIENYGKRYVDRYSIGVIAMVFKKLEAFISFNNKLITDK